MKFSFQTIDGKWKKDAFDCGNEDLNIYLKKYARQNHEKDISNTIIATNEHENVILGYYTTSMSEIEFLSLPPEFRKHLPRYPAPVMRIGKLAVDKTMQGKGLGGELLVHALQKAAEISKQVGVYGVIVDAKDETAVGFYEKYGFVLLQDSLTLIIKLTTIRQAFGIS